MIRLAFLLTAAPAQMLAPRSLDGSVGKMGLLAGNDWCAEPNGSLRDTREAQ